MKIQNENPLPKKAKSKPCRAAKPRPSGTPIPRDGPGPYRSVFRYRLKYNAYISCLRDKISAGARTGVNFNGIEKTLR